MSASNTRQKKSSVRLYVRLPQELHAELSRIAVEELRSLNQEAVVALMNHARSHRSSSRARKNGSGL